jgi:tetratricopeptide (TPR) repeat protein
VTDAYRQAHALADVQRWHDAERAARRGLADEPANADLLAFLSYLLRMQRDYPAALAAADAAVTADPARPDAHAERAESLLALIRDDDAIAAAREAARLDPLRPAGHLVLARSLASAQRFTEACAVARHGLSLAPRSVEALLTVADVERDAGHRAAAEAAARGALAIDPGNTYGRWLMAMLDGERLRVGRSMRGLRDVARDNPARSDVISMTWPIRSLLAGLRRWLPAAIVAVVICTPLAGWWPAAESAGRTLAVFFPAAVLALGARVLLPAGRLPWRCLRLVPRLMRRATIGGLLTVVAILALLIAYAGTGWWWLAAVTLLGAPALWAFGLAELFGARLDDPGFVHALRELGDGFREFGADLGEWWRTTKHDLREAWNGPASDKPEGPQT